MDPNIRLRLLVVQAATGLGAGYDDTTAHQNLQGAAPEFAGWADWLFLFMKCTRTGLATRRQPPSAPLPDAPNCRAVPGQRLTRRRR